MKSNQPMNQPALTAKRLLAMEIFLCITASIVLAALILFAAILSMADWQRAILITVGIAQFAVVVLCAIRIEQIVGFYQCTKCGHYYIPTYWNMLWAFHFGRTRYLKCPKCGQKSWQKKKLTK